MPCLYLRGSSQAKESADGNERTCGHRHRRRVRPGRRRRALAAAGAKVAVIDVNEKAATEVAADVKGIAVGCDVADSASAEAAVAAAAHGPVRILVNCAGVGPAKRIVGREGPMPLADFERVIRINLIGTFNMMRLVAAAMQPQNHCQAASVA